MNAPVIPPAVPPELAQVKPGVAASRGLSRRWAGAWVLVLTGLAAALRFAWLGYPDLWLDEAATYARTRGTFGELMRVLAGDGFTPLHYWVTWAVGQYLTLDAWSLRLVPAVAGVAMVPVMYGVARRLGMRREAAVMVGVLTATSAWGFTYARDAKMYAPTWLLMSVSWWLYLGIVRGRPRAGVTMLRWLAWMVVSTAAIGYHGTAAISVGLQVVLAPVLMLGPWQGGWVWARLPAVGLGAVLIAAGPAYYYWQFNDYIRRTGLLAVPAMPTTAEAEGNEREPDWRASGIQWVQTFNEGIPSAELALNTATSQLLGVQWPRKRVDPGYFTAPPPGWFVQGLHVAAAWLGLTLLAGLLPWKRARGMPWAGAMVLAVWVAVPLYGVFYCRSFPDFAPPWAAVTGVGAMMWGLMAGVAVGVGAIGTVWGGVRRVVSVGLLVGGVGVAGWGVYRAGWGWAEAVVGWSGAGWVLAGAIGALLGGHYLALGESLRARMAGMGRFAVAAAVVLGLCAACWAFWMWQKGQVPEGSWKSIWMPRYAGVVWPGLLLGVVALVDRLPLGVWRWGTVAVLAGLNVAQIGARLTVQTEPPLTQMAADFVRHQQQPDAYRVVYGLTDRPGRRMGGWDLPLSVHLHIATGMALPPEAIFASRILREVRFPANRSAEEVVRGLRRRPPEVLVIWQRLGNGEPVDEPLRLGTDGGPAGWVLTGRESFTQYQFWTWREGHTWVRWEYGPPGGPAGR